MVVCFFVYVKICRIFSRIMNLMFAKLFFCRDSMFEKHNFFTKEFTICFYEFKIFLDDLHML